MSEAPINSSSDQVRLTSPEVTPRRSGKPKLTAEERQAQRAAEMKAEIAAAARRVLATAPPPSEQQLALLARLCAAHPIAVQDERRSA